MRARRIIQFIVMLSIILCGNVAFAKTPSIAAAETINQKLIVKSEDEIPKEIDKNGKKYELRDYTLTPVGKPEPVKETKIYSTTETKTNLEAPAADFDSYINIETDDGFSGRLARVKNESGLDEEHSIISRRDDITVEIDHGYLHEKPYIEPYWEEDYIDEATQYQVHVRLPLVRTEERGERWVNARYYKFELEGDKSGRYYFPLSQDILNLNDAAPDPGTYSKDILWLMGLEQGYYRLNSVEWENDIQEISNKAGNDVTRRVAVFEIEEKETQYVSVYSAEYPIPDIPRYYVTATYEGYVTKTTTPTTEEFLANYTGDYEVNATYYLTDLPEEPEPEKSMPLAETLPVQETRDYTLPIVGSIAAGGVVIGFLIWWTTKNCIIQTEIEGKRHTLKRLHVRTPDYIDITPYTDKGENVIVLLHQKLLERAEDNIIIENHGVQYVASKEIIGKYAETYIYH